MSRNIKLSLLVIAGLIAAAVIGSVIYNERMAASTARQLWSEAKAMDECETRLTNVLNEQQKGNIPVRVDMSRYCFSHAVRQGQLIDFSISRTIYAEQSYETQVLLWMVVAITLSGVVLAGLQIVAAYRLAAASSTAATAAASAGPDLGGNIDFDKSGKLSVRSSVTGLLILIVSFAFFIVYVEFVYPLDHRFLDPADKAANETETGLAIQKPNIQTGMPASGTAVSSPGRQLISGGLGGAPAIRLLSGGGLGAPPTDSMQKPVAKTGQRPASATAVGLNSKKHKYRGTCEEGNRAVISCGPGMTGGDSRIGSSPGP